MRRMCTTRWDPSWVAIFVKVCGFWIGGKVHVTIMEAPVTLNLIPSFCMWLWVPTHFCKPVPCPCWNCSLAGCNALLCAKTSSSHHFCKWRILWNFWLSPAVMQETLSTRDFLSSHKVKEGLTMVLHCCKFSSHAHSKPNTSGYSKVTTPNCDISCSATPTLSTKWDTTCLQFWH
jgi:hypothetical protein